MAEFNAQIGVSVESRKVERAIDRLEKRLNRLRDKARDIQLGGSGEVGGVAQRLLPPARDLTRFEKLTKGISESAKRASNALKGLAVAGGALAGADAINTLGQSLEKAAVSFQVFGKNVSAPLPQINALGELLRQATSGIEPFVQALQSAGSGGLTTAAGIATATTAFIAFEPAIEKALGKLRAAERLFSVFGPRVKETGISFEGYIQKIRKTTDIVSQLRESQQLIRRELDNVNSSTEEASDTADAYNRVTKRLNDELFRQEQLLKRSARAQQEFNNQSRVGTNLARSRASRAGSGFADFSRSASEVNTDQQAIDKAVARRQRKIEQFAKGLDDKYGQAPLMLPSSEMLNAAGRGIKRLSNYYGDLNTNIDKGLQAGRQFTEQLNAQAAKAQSLPPIFNQVARALEATQKATSKAARLVGDPNATRTAAGPIQARTAGLRKLAALEQRLLTETAELRAKKDLQSYNTRRKRIKYLADQEKAAQKKRAALTESLALGAGFPLLFGAGAGSVLGSIGGSFVGSGFGGQILGGAVGQIIDDFTQKLNAVATSLSKPKEALEALEEAGIKVDDAVKRQVDSLLEVGKAYEAQQIVLQQITDTLGPEAVGQLDAYAQETKELEKRYQEVYTALVKELLPAMLGFVTVVNNLAGAFDNMPDWVKKFISGATSSGPFSIARFPIETLQNAGRDRATPSVYEAVNGSGIPAPEVDPKFAEQEAKLKQAAEERKRNTQIQNDNLQAQLNLLNSGLDLTTTRGFELAKEVITVEYLGKLEDIRNQKIDDGEKAIRRRQAALEQSIAIANLENRQATALASAQRDAQRAAEEAAREQDRVFQGLNNAAKKAIDLSIRYAEATGGREAAIERSLTMLDRQAGYEIANIQANEKNLQLRNFLIDNLNIELDLKKKALKTELTLLALERERTLESIRRQKADSSFQAGSQLQSIQAQLANPFGGDALAQQLQVIEQQNRRYSELTQIKRQILDLDNEIASGVYKGKELDNLRAQQRLQTELLDQRRTELDLLDQAEQKLLRQQQLFEQYGFIASEISTALSDSIVGVIKGTETVEQAFARMFENIGRAFIDMATQMLAQKLFLTVLEAFGGGGGGVGTGIGKFLGGQKPFAEGGYVTGPTRAIVGEGGEPEYVIPESKMADAMQRYAGGATGDNVVNGPSPIGGGGAAIAEAPTSITINGGITQFGGNEYIRKEELPKIIEQSSRLGEARTLRRLQMNPGSRRRIGL